jgi:anthranilate phosphoribosyltransferase
MATQTVGSAQEMAYKLTKEQITQALELASNAIYDGKVDPHFVGSVLVALAINTQTAGEAMKRR